MQSPAKPITSSDYEAKGDTLMTDSASEKQYDEFDETPPKKGQDPQVDMQRKVTWLLSQYIEREASDELGDIADYLSFIAQRINTETVCIEADGDLIRCFEAIVLLLGDRLRPYPATIREQVASISRDARLCDTLALLGSLSEQDIANLRNDRFLDRLVKPFLLVLRRWGSSVSNSDPEVNRAQFLRMKVAINRLASIVRYAATIKMGDYDDSVSSVRNNYDPELIDKSKLIAFINVLRVEINQHPDSAEKSTIIQRLEVVERELRKPRVRWGIVVTSLFMLFGFLADLKTLYPGIYTRPYQMVNTMLNTIHCDGVVNKAPVKLLGNTADRENGHEDQSGDYQESAMLPKKDDEDEEMS